MIFLSFIKFYITCRKIFNIITLKKKKKMYNRCPTRNRPWSSGPKVWHAYKMYHSATRAGHAQLKITVHIGQTIRVSDTHIRKQSEPLEVMYIVWLRPINLSVLCTKTISSDKGSIDISDTFYSDCICQENMTISIWHKSILKLYWIDFVNGRKTGPRQLYLFLDAGMVCMGIIRICL